MVRALLEDGAAVVGTFRDPAAEERARRELGAGDERVALERVDLTERGEVERMVAGTIAQWGRLDYLINVAGAWAGGRPLWETAVRADRERGVSGGGAAGSGRRGVWDREGGGGTADLGGGVVGERSGAPGVWEGVGEAGAPRGQLSGA